MTAFILKALESSGYVERSFYQTGDGGVALVTRLEKIGDDGAPAAEAERWPADVDSNQSGGFINFVRGLFFAPPGHYRTIVFVLQEKSFRASGGPVTGKDADEWLKGGVECAAAGLCQASFRKGQPLHCADLRVRERWQDRLGWSAVRSRVNSICRKPACWPRL